MADVRFASLGDSSGVGVGAGFDGGYPARVAARLQQRGVAVTAHNVAESGATSSDLVRSQLGPAVRGRPDLVSVGIGGNDLWRMVPVASYQRNLQTIADGLGTVAGVDVVFVHIVDLSLAPIAAMAEGLVGVSRAQIAERVDELNAALATVVDRANAAARNGARFVVAEVSQERRRVRLAPPGS
jgi:lysophospholipase L1-like esterase